MLTKQQRDLLLFIDGFVKKTGLSPSFEEMKEGLDLKSKSGIHRLINALVERGFLARLPNKARALEVRKLPENVANGNARRLKAAAASGKNLPEHDEVMHLPLYGKIAAGTPIEALRNETETFPFPLSMASGMQSCYALTIEGDSMVDAGIIDGDIVIIERCDHANDEEIVVALIDGEEATLKRLHRESGSIILKPENKAYKPMRLSPDRVRIQGKLRSLFRNY